ncbi:MAG: hypothetical protein IPJ08_20740 [Burkholderiales bacterium]|nr:hypothetical protein [Burkholderiales bacterium]
MNHMPMLALRAQSYQTEPTDRPRIRANRQEVDDRFPVLGFTIDTRGLPWYEVIVASQPAHFDPSRAHERDSSFYSSRADSGLISAETTVYTVPSAVLKRFAPGRSIFYTLVAYADQQLSGAAPSHTLAELLHDAPRVQLAAGFSGRTLAAVLGVPSHLLQRVPPRLSESLAAQDVDDDRGEGEDGYGRASEAYAAANPWDEDPTLATQAESPYGEAQEDGAAYGYGQSDGSSQDEPAEGTDGAVANSASWGFDDTAYDDGFGALNSGSLGEPSAEPPYDYDELSAAAESSYPRGSSAPAMLQDDEDADDGYAASAYADGYEDHASGYAADALALDVPAQRRLLEAVLAVAGPPDGYATTLADAEFNGQLGEHPARGRYHLGLAFGMGLASQDRGDLGALLRLMQQRDAAMFQQVFGPQAAALLEVTNRSGPGAAESPDGRGPRVQPVGGEDLWSPGWLALFKESARADLFGAGKPQLFNGAQNEQLVGQFLTPMLPLARLLGLDTQRGLGVLFDRALQMGVKRAVDWVLAAISPVQTLAQRQQALAALGHASLEAFQRSQAGVPADGVWGPMTHASLLAALRALGTASPLPLPQGAAAVLAALQRRAATEPWQARMARVLGALDDTRYAL